jgi:hypothetical protein
MRASWNAFADLCVAELSASSARIGEQCRQLISFPEVIQERRKTKGGIVAR